MARFPTSESLIGRAESLRPTGVMVEGARSAVPDALASAGNNIKSFADSMATLENQESTLDVTRAQAALNKAKIELDASFDYAKDQDYATWEKRHSEGTTAALNQAAAIIRDPKRREIFQLHNAADLSQSNIRVRERAAGIGRGADRAKFDQSIDDNVAASTAPNVREEDANKIAAQTVAAIDSAVATGIITPEEGVQRKRRFEERRAGIQVERDIATDPEAARSRFGRGATTTVVDRIIGVESGGRNDAKNPNSTATGAGQFIDGTWMQFIRERYPDLAGNRAEALALRSNKELSREAVAWYAQSNSRALRENGMADTPGNIYLGHFLGPGGMIKALRADSNASVASVLGNDVVAANGFLAGKDIGWLKAWADRKMDGAAGGIDQRYARLSAEQRARYADQADRANDRFLSQRRIDREEVRSSIKDDLASIEATGVPLQTLTRDKVAQIMGEAGARDWERERSRATSFHEVVKSFDTMPVEQMQRMVESKKPEGGSEDFEANQKAYERLRKMSDKMIEERQQDPAQSVSRVENVQKAEAAMKAAPSNPETWRALAKARLDAQRAVGVPEQSLTPISYREATALAQPVIDASAKSMAETNIALNNLQTMLERNFGEHADEAMVYILQTATLSRETAEVAQAVLSKIIRGQMPAQSDLRAVDDAAARAAAERAMGNGIGPGSMDGFMPSFTTSEPTQSMTPMQDFDPMASTRSRAPSNDSLKALRDGKVTPEQFDAAFGKGSAAKVMPILKGSKPQ